MRATGIHQTDAVSRSQDGFSLRCGDDSRVSDVVANQVNLSASGRGDAALIEDGVAVSVGEIKPVLHEVGVGDVHGRGHQSVHVDYRTAAKQDACLIDQIHIPIGA